MIKQVKDTHFIRPFRGRRQPQTKGGVKVIQQGLVRRCPGVVNLIDDQIIKFSRFKRGQIFLQGLDGRKQVLSAPVVSIASQQTIIAFGTPQNLLKTAPRLLQNLLPVSHKQQPLGPRRLHRKGRQIRLARPSGGND